LADLPAHWPTALRVFVKELGHGGARLGRAALSCLPEQPAELDVRLLLGRGGGLEADLPLGNRIDPGVHPRAPRSARQLLYVTLGNPLYDNRIARIGIIRSTNRSTHLVPKWFLGLLTWEPVIGFEPMACRLQDGRSAY
jgi:hypothetical protein